MPPLTCHLLRLHRQGRVLRQGRILRQGRALRQGGVLRHGRSLRQGTTPAAPPAAETTTAKPGTGKPLASKLPLGSSLFDLLFGYLLDFSSFSGRQTHLLQSRWRPRLLSTTPLPPKKRPALMIPSAKRPPWLSPQQL